MKRFLRKIGSITMDNESRSDIFLSYSGGADSAMVLYLLMKQGRNVLVNHVHYKDRRGRAKREYLATHSTIDWLRSQDLPGKVEYTEISVDVSSMEKWPRDASVWVWSTGSILSLDKYSHINEVATGRHLNAFNTGTASMEHLKETIRWYGAVLPALAGREITLVHPIGHMTKYDIIHQMPPDLRSLTWSCRRPTRNGACGKCHTCKQIEAADNGEVVKPLDVNKLIAEGKV